MSALTPELREEIKRHKKHRASVAQQAGPPKQAKVSCPSGGRRVPFDVKSMRISMHEFGELNCAGNGEVITAASAAAALKAVAPRKSAKASVWVSNVPVGHPGSGKLR
ncbi:MAG: hypothetical protein QOJ20_4159 [Mycobacterium sp.]|nr:hypothetical protein [Mycobacterium sp.]